MLEIQGVDPDSNWQKDASCRGTDPELFFPDKGKPQREAKIVCNGCPVKAECLDYAIKNGEKFGIWGGMSERERRRIRDTRAVARQAINNVYEIQNESR